MSEKLQKSELDAFFLAAGAGDPMPSGNLMARIEAQALAEMPEALSEAPVAHPTIEASGTGFLTGALAALGGWAGAVGLATACALGVVIGLNVSVNISGEIASYDQTETASYSNYGIGLIEEFETALLME